MKTKFICVFFSILMVVLSFSLTVHAEQYDSLRLPENERTDMAEAPDDTVIKLYVGIFYDNFAKGQSIEEITSGNSNLTDRLITYLIISPTEGYTKMKQYYNGTVSRIRGDTNVFIPEWAAFSNYATTPELVFDSSVQVNATYCLDASSSHHGVCIYYVTNQGDYVLYKQYLTDDCAEYLFPSTNFYEFCEAIDNELRKNSDLTGGAPIEELYDLTPYKFEPRQENASNASLWLWIVSGVLLVILVCGFAFYKIRKTKNA
jgi:hypothetical protein